ncbi:MAG TPA: DoxX family protein [Gemmatimonadales bacterium]
MTEPNLATKWRSWSPYLLSILRIIVAFLFIQFGSTKLFALPAAVMPEGGTAPFGTLAWFAGFLETFGGPFILLGLFTRPVAFLLSGEMAFAYFIGHAPQGFWPVLNQGHAAILFCFVFLYFSSVGAGPWSLDALRERGTPGRSGPTGYAL